MRTTIPARRYLNETSYQWRLVLFLVTKTDSWFELMAEEPCLTLSQCYSKRKQFYLIRNSLINYRNPYLLCCFCWPANSLQYIIHIKTKYNQSFKKLILDYSFIFLSKNYEKLLIYSIHRIICFPVITAHAENIIKT